MPNTPGTLLFPNGLDDADSLLKASNNALTTLSTNVNASATTLSVGSTSSFSSTGAVTVDDEIIFYTGITSTTLTGCIRGGEGTSPSSHVTGAKVEMLIMALYHNLHSSAIIAVETKLGSGSSTPSTGKALQGAANGVSQWVDIPSYLELDLSSAGSTVTLDSDQCRQPRIILEGSLTGTVTIEFLNLHQIWTIEDDTTRNGFQIFIRKTGGSSKELYPGEIADFRASGI